MNALELADKLKKYKLVSGYAWYCHKAADELRRQHEAIVKLREALHNTNQSLIGNTTFTYSPNADEVIAAAEQALKDTEGLV